MAGERLHFRVSLVVNSNFDPPDPQKVGSYIYEYLSMMQGVGAIEDVTIEHVDDFNPEEVASRPTIPAPPSEEPK